MATQQANYQKFFANNAIKLFESDTGATAAVDIAWVDMRDFERFVAAYFRSVDTTAGVAVFKILANSEADGSGTDVILVSHDLDDDTDAVGDQVFLECSAEQLADASTTASGLLRYVSVSITPGDNGEEAIILYIRTNARYPKTSLTADIVA